MSARRQLTAVFGAAAIAVIAVAVVAAGSDPELPNRRARAATATSATTLPRATSTTAPTRPVRPARVEVFGDSLMHEAAGDFALMLGSTAPIDLHAYPMTAPCDFTDAIARTLSDPPRVAVFEFSGNAITKCMRAADGSGPTPEARAGHYASDATSITERFTAAGTIVFWVDAPRGRPGTDRADQFSGAEPFTATIYRSTVREFRSRGFDVRFVAASRALLAADGSWTEALPCTPTDRAAGACTNGSVVVRAPDGAHFCPSGVTDESGGCSTWSSGAWRYASAIAEAIRPALG